MLPADGGLQTLPVSKEDQKLSRKKSNLNRAKKDYGVHQPARALWEKRTEKKNQSSKSEKEGPEEGGIRERVKAGPAVMKNRNDLEKNEKMTKIPGRWVGKLKRGGDKKKKRTSFKTEARVKQEYTKEKIAKPRNGLIRCCRGVRMQKVLSEGV